MSRTATISAVRHPSLTSMTHDPAAAPVASVTLLTETSDHCEAIDALHRDLFGPGASTRAAARLREQGPHDPARSFVALDASGVLVGTVRLTPIRIGDLPAWLLGPLAVRAELKGRGIGRDLLRRAEEAADAPFLLVGDPPYYGPHGYKPVPAFKVTMPGPVDPARLLVAGVDDEARASLSGLVRHARIAC